MRWHALPPLFILALATVGFAACGDDDAANEPSGTVGTGTDEGYLRAICVGSQNYSKALNTATTADEIARVVRDFIAEMKKANPPADLVAYNTEFIKYLQDSVEDPTSLVTRNPPLPSKDIQRRLASLEPSISECRDGTFFSRASGE
jgi:hypothetical protein